MWSFLEQICGSKLQRVFTLGDGCWLHIWLPERCSGGCVLSSTVLGFCRGSVKITGGIVTVVVREDDYLGNSAEIAANLKCWLISPALRLGSIGSEFTSLLFSGKAHQHCIAEIIARFWGIMQRNLRVCFLAHVVLNNTSEFWELLSASKL